MVHDRVRPGATAYCGPACRGDGAITCRVRHTPYAPNAMSVHDWMSDDAMRASATFDNGRRSVGAAAAECHRSEKSRHDKAHDIEAFPIPFLPPGQRPSHAADRTARHELQAPLPARLRVNAHARRRFPVPAWNGLFLHGLAGSQGIDEVFKSSPIPRQTDHRDKRSTDVRLSPTYLRHGNDPASWRAWGPGRLRR
jgi:hypothetical protein